jgi:aspartate carbamoyltransferase catalytic subunit
MQFAKNTEKSRTDGALKIKHLLGLNGVCKDDIVTILDEADKYRRILDSDNPVVDNLRGKTVVNLFYENSTRTRISFELAQKRLSANPLNFSVSGSAVSKGESLKDTVENIEAMKIDTIVVRHSASGVPKFLTEFSKAVVINAGDGFNEHPTQALLDIMTIRQKLGRLEGVNVAIIGDILHSRVARSNVWGMRTLGMNVVLCGPTTLLPQHPELLGVKTTSKIDDAIENADVVMLLRMQLERQDSGLFPSVREYRQLYGLDKAKIEKMKKDAIIMHPGPINRSMEIASEIADCKRSVILDQVTNGVATRMAVLSLLSSR